MEITVRFKWYHYAIMAVIAAQILYNSLPITSPAELLGVLLALVVGPFLLVAVPVGVWRLGTRAIQKATTAVSAAIA